MRRQACAKRSLPRADGPIPPVCARVSVLHRVSSFVCMRMRVDVSHVYTRLHERADAYWLTTCMLTSTSASASSSRRTTAANKVSGALGYSALNDPSARTTKTLTSSRS